jgi:hypothetical protein
LLKTSTPLPSSPEGKVRNICFCWFDGLTRI